MLDQLKAQTPFDVAIAGGGPAGCATALALARRGHRCLVVEKSSYADLRVGETLPAAVRRLLIDLGAWERFMAAGFIPAHVIAAIWGADRAHENAAIFDPYGHGWHIDRQRFDRLLAQAAVDAGVTLAQQARITSSDIDDRGLWRLRIDSAGSACDARARMLVDATGRAACIARRMGARRICADRLVGLTGFFRRPGSDIARNIPMLVEAVEDGWWYSAPLPDRRLAVAYLTDADLAGNRAAGVSKRFLGQLERASRTSARLRECHWDDGPKACAANSSYSSPMCAGHWVAVGDAAMAFDPLASQGVYRALGSGLQAAAAIEQHWGGDPNALKDYERRLIADFDRYLAQRRHFYRLERRWPKQEFWRRRQGSNRKTPAGRHSGWA